MSSARVRDDATDEELAACAQGGDDDALELLLTRYAAMARAKAHTYFLVGADRDDLVQEGLIGLYKAIGEFDPDLGAAFRTFAELCVTRQVVTAVRAATRHKHGPLNDYLSFHRPMLVDDDREVTLGDMLPAAPHTDPAEQVLFAERVRDLRQHVDVVLSDLETEVLRLHVDGRSYQEIARTLKRHTKSIDNALQRIKRKVGSHFVQWDAEIA